ncbi:MAG: hypothetical protein IT324_07325 [Anaerolineae bacterium]|nr:hypothetical protein [Anaerolineae bacterium]
MADRQVDYAAIRHRADERMKRQKRVGQIVLFIVNVLLFVIFTAIALGAVLSNPALRDWVAQKNSPAAQAFILPTVGWLVGIMLQGMALVLDTRMGERSLREKIIMREMHDAVMQMADAESAEKPKRDQVMRLSDDGELVLDNHEARERMESREG